MSLPEWALAALLAVATVASVRGPRPWLVLAAVVGAGLLLAFGTPRWQLGPAGLALVLLVGLTALQLTWPDAPITAPRVTAVVVLLGLAASAGLAWLLPVPRFALEPGSGTVGTVAFDVVDPSRSSPSGRTDPDEPRVTPVQAWYPAAADATGDRLRVTDEPGAFAAAVSSFLGLPSFALTHLGAARTNALVGAAPVAPDEGLPVVLSLHGWGGFRFAQAPLLEQLAADGHLVLAVDHTHASLAAQPAAGGVVAIDRALLPDDAPPQVYDAASRILEQTFAADAAAVLAAFRSGDTQVPEAVRAAADLDRLVVLGHSTGGGAAVLLCADEGLAEDCAGLVTYDPWVEPLPPAVRRSGFPVPSLVLLSEEWEGNDNDAVLRPMVGIGAPTRLAVVEGTKHRDVTVESRLSPLGRVLGISGDLDPQRVDAIVLRLTRAALAETLGSGPGDPADLDALDTVLPAVRPA